MLVFGTAQDRLDCWAVQSIANSDNMIASESSVLWSGRSGTELIINATSCCCIVVGILNEVMGTVYTFAIAYIKVCTYLSVLWGLKLT